MNYWTPLQSHFSSGRSHYSLNRLCLIWLIILLGNSVNLYVGSGIPKPLEPFVIILMLQSCLGICFFCCRQIFPSVRYRAQESNHER